MKRARLLDLGLRSYGEVWDLQHELHERVRRGEDAETWIFVEHAPVVTLGRNAKEENLLLTREALAQRGVEVVRIERGGDVTYHGPGQLVVYPIRRLERFREVVPLVRALEGAIVEVCAHFGVQAERWSEHAGVWVGKNQICAIGLAVQKMTSLHGIALNVSTELNYDALINPCGLTDRGLTSLSRETGRPVSVEEAKPIVKAALSKAFGVEFAGLDELGRASIPQHDTGAGLRHDTGAVPRHDAGTMPRHDAGAIPRHDAGAIPRHDAGAVTRDDTAAVTRDDTAVKSA